MRLENLDTCNKERRDELIENAGAVVFFDERLLVGHDVDTLAEFCSYFNENAKKVLNDPFTHSLPIVTKLQSFGPSERDILAWLRMPYVPNIHPIYHQMAEYLLLKKKNVYYFADTFLEQAQIVAQVVGIPETNLRAHKAVYNRDKTFRDFSRNTNNARLSRTEHLCALGRELGCETIAYFAADLTDKPIRLDQDEVSDEVSDESDVEEEELQLEERELPKSAMNFFRPYLGGIVTLSDLAQMDLPSLIELYYDTCGIDNLHL